MSIKKFRNQLFTFEDGKDILIDVIVENDSVTDIIASENFENFMKGDIINSDGDNSLIRSEDIFVEELK